MRAVSSPRSMQTQLKGRAWTFGDSIDTDMITPGKYLAIIDPKGLAEHLLEGKDPEFAKRVKPGDIIVAGQNFGCGSSREHAVAAMKGAEIACVVAESFARIFYRNSLNLALPILEVPDISKHVKTGDVVEVDLTKGTVKNTTSGKTLKGTPLTDKAVELLEAGGLVNIVRKKLHARGTVQHQVTPAPRHADFKRD
jgi:3-isopropylmalate/(R)-2-methylmalate dehydratase small subunit